MKISDEELIHCIWINQLRLLSTSVIHNYFGGSVGVVCNDDFWYSSASSGHVCSIEKITDIIGRQQLRKRLKRLYYNDLLAFPNGSLLTFFIDSIEAKKAFVYARNFWLKNGVPEGFEDNKCRTAKIANMENLSNELIKELNEKFNGRQ